MSTGYAPFSGAPVFTALSVITLAVGVGADTAIFTVVEGVLLKPLASPHPTEPVDVPALRTSVVSGKCHLPSRRAAIVDPVETLRAGGHA